MIFQGAFDEMQRGDKKADPKALAASARLHWRMDQDAGDRMRSRSSFRRRYNRQGRAQQLRVYSEETL